ncbi:LysR family transcriptional regulator [Azospirillum sp. BE72]|uniref:LysR family transcriptional regulator n=1 Tax=Azospirillum sp. BE72 TaxID=2817776 RepID=UPI002863E691|nr:LysR family transcriptional regulator [Azospirillum sp. BE72]MDR6774828.1 DNA-binding transcriptional LysR family regulator [Azospirillum sp. BE72]
MKAIHNPALDLNLIKVFDALLETRNVSRAAEALGVSQSAVSHALGRLRTLVGDPLFVRTGNRMEPTPRAQRLAEPLRDLLVGAARALSAEEDFDPHREERSFSISTPDSMQAVLLTGILRDAAEGDLRVSVALRSLDPDAMLDALDDGTLDLAIGYLPEVRRWHDRQVLYRETHVCLYNPDLVPVTPPIGLEDYTRYPHLMPSLRGGLTSFIDDELAALGTRRRVAASTTQFLAIPMILTRAPMLTSLPARLASLCADSLGLATSPLPFDVGDYEVSMIWHRRNTGSPSHSWLRQRIGEEAAKL